jgi:hypothetical protein
VRPSLASGKLIPMSNCEPIQEESTTHRRLDKETETSGGRVLGLSAVAIPVLRG